MPVQIDPTHARERGVWDKDERRWVERAVARNFDRRDDREARYIEYRLHEYEQRRGPIQPEQRRLLIAYWSHAYRRRTPAGRPHAAGGRVPPLRPRPEVAQAKAGPLVQTFDEISKALGSPDPVVLGLGAAVAVAAIATPLWAAISVAALAVVAIVVVSVVRNVLASTVPASEVGQRAIQWWTQRDLPQPEGFADPSWAKLEDDLCQHAGMWREQYLSGEITAEELDARLDNALLEPQRKLARIEQCKEQGHDYDEFNSCRRCKGAATTVMGDRIETQIPPDAAAEQVELLLKNHRRHALKIGGTRPAYQCDGAHVVTMGDAEQRCRVCHLTPTDPGW